MQPLIRRATGDGTGRIVTIAHTTRAEGDLSPATVDPEVLDERRRAIVARPWATVRQVHSDRVVIAGRGGVAARPVADALVTTDPSVVLAVHSGDCVPIGLVANGAVAAVHAGWRGLELGVIESAVRTLRTLRSVVDGPVEAAIGPHIRADRYVFGATDLARLAQRFGAGAETTTPTGEPALDLAAAVRAECARLDVAIVASSADCTAADADSYWSHRDRKESGRIALLAWMEDGDG